ncbi:dna repair protein dds20 mei5 [Diplodia corticola]|uniref:Dna repair protein dds20 mei5 n=1 Tax=Diplodia corticola TaxID=236234 RepID=A0A1J9S7A0_9PEZI|nr:dna repair protein dds20 mei5 [Diplodia corticola]OJD35796.1 dna repair protein dds20 mei5 [Diplodia corticola]
MLAEEALLKSLVKPGVNAGDDDPVRSSAVKRPQPRRDPCQAAPAPREGLAVAAAGGQELELQPVAAVTTQHSMSTPSAKRRRLEDAQSALRKPFRSPFKTPSRKVELESPKADTTASSTAVPSPLVQSTLPDSSAAQSLSVSSLRTLRSSRSSTTLSTPSRPPLFAQRVGAVDHDDALETAIRAEEQRQRDLSRQIRSIRVELDTLNQALKIATSTKDAELQALTRKWRDATRAAAEDVFATTKDRVNGMGGIGVWKQNEQRQQEWRLGFHAQEHEPTLDESDEDEEENVGLTPEEKEAKLVAREQRAEARAEAKKERHWREQEAEAEAEAEAEEEALRQSRTDDGGDDDSFTMDTMLKTLNIDLKMIGWDKEGQRWVD